MSTIETAATSTTRRWMSSRSRNDRVVRRPRRSLRMTAVLAIGRSILPISVEMDQRPTILPDRGSPGMHRAYWTGA